MASSEDISKPMQQVFVFKPTCAFVLPVQPAGIVQACVHSAFLKGNTGQLYLCTVLEQIHPQKS